jgi:hypothetical protein
MTGLVSDDKYVPIKQHERVYIDAGINWLVRPIPIFERIDKTEELRLAINGLFLSIKNTVPKKVLLYKKTGFAAVCAELETQDLFNAEISSSLLPGKFARYIFDNAYKTDQNGFEVQCHIEYLEGKIYPTYEETREKAVLVEQSYDEQNRPLPLGAVDRYNPQTALIARALNNINNALKS